MEKNQKSIPKDKLIGMQVIDAEGNLVGKVKDVSFVIGQPSISLSVEDKSGKATDISWDRVQGAADFIVLKPTPQTAAAPATAAQTAQSAQPVCPTCGGPLTYIPQYKRWYCYKDQKYV
ncbi:MAG: PRC-barrel domain-containing protein [Candidatus Bathyarchaeia archaeon]